MKSTGIVRNVDELGRIVIPMELRRTMEIKPETPMEIFVDRGNIIFRKYAPGCEFCGKDDKKFANVSGKLICSDCITLIRKSDL